MPENTTFTTDNHSKSTQARHKNNTNVNQYKKAQKTLRNIKLTCVKEKKRVPLWNGQRQKPLRKWGLTEFTSAQPHPRPISPLPDVNKNNVRPINLQHQQGKNARKSVLNIIMLFGIYTFMLWFWFRQRNTSVNILGI